MNFSLRLLQRRTEISDAMLCEFDLNFTRKHIIMMSTIFGQQKKPNNLINQIIEI